MFIFVAVLLSDLPANFTVTRESVTIDRVVWYDAKGQQHVTEQPYLQIRLRVVNDADHPIRWSGFLKARVTYGKNRRSAVLQVKPFEDGARWENSLVTDQVVQPKEQNSILVVLPVPRERGSAGLELQWRGETQGIHMTIKQGFQLPADK